VKSYDAVIIGGGVIGAAVAYYLSREDIQAVLVERGSIASGTSCRCDGNVLIADKKPGFDTHMAAASQGLLKELVEQMPCDFEYTQRGSLYVIESEQEWEVAEGYVSAQVADGYPLRMMTKEELLRDEPYLADDLIGGVEIGCDASLNPIAFALAMAAEAERNGVDIYRHMEVLGIQVDSLGAIKAVETSRGVINTERVINCAGVWAPEIGRMVGIDIPIVPRQGQILVAEKTFEIGKRKIVEFGYMMAKFGPQHYRRDVEPELDELGIAMVFEPTESGNFLIGSSRAFVGYNTDVSLEVMRGLARRAVRFFPAMKNINVIRAYAGLRPYVSDHFPIISAVEEVPGFYIAAGHEGDGIGLAPLTGKLMSQLILDREPLLPIERLSFSRFA